MSAKETIHISGVDQNLISDGYHTFGELYDHRIELWIALCRIASKLETNRPLIWKSTRHSDGSFMEGWFVLGMHREPGMQITYHLPNSRWIDCAFANTWEFGPDFDRHTPSEVVERLKTL